MAFIELSTATIVAQGIAIVSAGLFFVSWYLSYRRRIRNGRRFRVERDLLPQISIALVLILFFFIGFPRLIDINWVTMLESSPETSVVFLLSSTVILLVIFLRVVEHLHQRK